jgi:hypothetical protein
MAKQRRIRAIIENVESFTSTELLSSEILKDLLFREVPNSIEEAVKTNSSYATIFEVNNSGYYMELHKRDWVSALSCCLTEQVSREDYKECSRINKLITALQKKQSKNIKTKSDGKIQRTEGGDRHSVEN